MNKKILFIRLDKIGDLICTLCCDDHPRLKEYSKHWLISKDLEFIPEHSDPKRFYSTLTKDQHGFWNLYRFLKANSFEASVSFQCPWWVHFLLFYFRIPVRVGVLSKWHSFLFLNKGLRQRRSHAEAHESDYNFQLTDLLAHTLDGTSGHRIPHTPVLKMTAPPAELLLPKWNLKPRAYFIVHPGMAGSSLNWPQENYIDFISRFHTRYPDLKIVMTGTAADTTYLDKIASHFQSCDYFLNTQGKVNTLELLSLLAGSSGLLAPSTGVMHLSAALGTPTFGIFSTVKVQRPTRWAPRGNFVKTYAPPVDSSETAETLIAKLDIFEQFTVDFESFRRQRSAP